MKNHFNLEALFLWKVDYAVFYYVVWQWYITLFAVHMQLHICIILGVCLECWLFIDGVSSMQVICRWLCWKNYLSWLICALFDTSCRPVKVTTEIFSLKMYDGNVFYYSVINESLRRVGFRNLMQYADYEMALWKVFGRMYGLTYEGTISRLLHKCSVMHIK